MLGLQELAAQTRRRKLFCQLIRILMFDIGKKVYSRIQSRLKNCFGPFVMPGPNFWLFRHRHIFRLFIFWSKKRFLATRLVYQKLDAGMQICLAYVAFLIRPRSTNQNSEIPRTCHSFLSLAPPWCIFCFLSSGFIFHMICGETLKECIYPMYQFLVIQWREECSRIWWRSGEKNLDGIRIWTRDLLTQM